MELELYGDIVKEVTAEIQSAPQSKGKHWVFTWNNPADGEAPKWNPEKMAYMVYQLEAGKQGTRHYQGYVRFKGQQRFNAVKELLGTNGIYISLARGNEEQNKKYCTKPGGLAPPVEQGTFNGNANRKGNRSDLDAIADEIIKGSSTREIALSYKSDYIRYSQGIEKFAMKVQPPPPTERLMMNIWIYGTTSIGKTHRVLHHYSDPYLVVPGRDPWSGYEKQKVVVFDEFNLAMWTPQAMNRYADKWRLKLDCRYFDKVAAWNLLIVISNNSPSFVLKNVEQELQAALLRRFQWPCGRCMRPLSREVLMPLPPDPETPQGMEETVQYEQVRYLETTKWEDWCE